MSLEAERIDSVEGVNRNQWNNVVEQSDLGCIYHRHEWLRAIEAGTSDEPRHLVVRKKDNPIAVFPNFVTGFGPVRRLCSIEPGYGGPIAMTDEEQALEELLDAVPDLCDGRVAFNVLRTYDQQYVRYHELLRERGYGVAVLSCRFTLDLSEGWEAVFDGMHSERRRGIRRGNDYDHEVVEVPVTDRTLSAFYEDYETVMDRVGLPTLPLSFVLELDRLDDRVKMFALEVDGERHGAYLYLLDEEQSTLQHLFTAVTREDFEYHAPELLHEHAIKWGIEEGYDTYELRGARPDFRDGVFRFKEYFGAEAMPLLSWERGRPGPALSVLNAGRSLYRQFVA